MSELAVTHLRFNSREKGEGWLLWSRKLSDVEIIPIQHYKSIDEAPRGAFKLEEREEWITAPFVIVLLAEQPRVVHRFAVLETFDPEQARLNTPTRSTPWTH